MSVCGRQENENSTNAQCAKEVIYKKKGGNKDQKNLKNAY